MKPDCSTRARATSSTGRLAAILQESLRSSCTADPGRDVPDGDVVDEYARRLADPDPAIRRAAAEDWCRWESATPHWPPRDGLDARFQDPQYATAFARIVTHFVRHNLFLEDDELLRGAGALAHIPATLINGRFDFQSPLKNAWDLHSAWPGSQLVVVDDAGHSANERIGAEIIRATDGFR